MQDFGKKNLAAVDDFNFGQNMMALNRGES